MQEKEQKISPIKDRILKFAETLGISKREFYATISVSRGTLESKTGITEDVVAKFIAKYPDVSIEWLITGEGNMLKNSVHSQQSDRLIPLYEDVASIGGINSISASMDGVMPSSEFIDAGDWFRGATAAIRHYGDSMLEYPSGCIIVLKEVHDKRQVVWGRNYCIETQEFRITKKLQRGNQDHCYTAYSTNTSTYPDGHLIHEPISIEVDDIRRLFLVMGCVIKEQSSGPIYIQD